jgi:hypothetical protein
MKMADGLMTSGTEKRFDLKDGQRPITFLGWELGSANSQTGTDVRWTELALYKTLSGRYVLEKIGRSDVFHTDACTRRSKGVRYDDLEAAVSEDEDPDTDIEDLFVPCKECNPSYDDVPVWVERDIAAVAVFDSADKVVQSLFRNDRDNMRFLSRVSRSLLEEAALHDDGIKEVMSSPADVT